eukprot:TRINITY_DN7887_c0_g3_i1.p3 TRINITY_DN7887_c0_g3~~TRINITY_DN7887_c0_g3_i1.p3  ORF type:complete len:142 (+),score=39.00 TRINITY_DN7887_c0_g3_i1:1251-1676(+)
MIFFYTSSNIKKGEELFFNYDETGKLAEYFDWAGDSQKKKELEDKRREKAKAKTITKISKRRGRKRKKISEVYHNSSNTDSLPIKSASGTPRAPSNTGKSERGRKCCENKCEDLLCEEGSYKKVFAITQIEEQLIKSQAMH